jgi:hypothetical protein
MRIHVSNIKSDDGIYDFVDIADITISGYRVKYDYHELKQGDYIKLTEIYDLIVNNIPSNFYYFTLPTESIEWSKFITLYEFLLDFFTKRNILHKLKIFDNNIGAIPSYNNPHYEPILGMLTWNKLDYEYISVEDRNIERHFLSLNRRAKKHRYDLVKFITDNNLTDKFYYSYLGDSPGDKLRKVIDFKSIDVGEPKEWEILTKFNNKVFCDIVTESEYEDTFDKNFKLYESLFEDDTKLIHITEKIGKPLLVGQPFLLLSGPLYLKKLHQLGFKTFDKWWDESYDLELDYEKRRDMVYSIILDIYSWSSEHCKEVMLDMEDIFIHNHNLLKQYKRKYEKFTEFSLIEFNTETKQYIKLNN